MWAKDSTVRLTNLKIKNLSICKRVRDGRRLYLALSSPGRGKWTFLYMLHKKAKEMRLGKFPEVSLAKARKRHFASLIQVADGIDPVEMKKKAPIVSGGETTGALSQRSVKYYSGRRMSNS